MSEQSCLKRSVFLIAGGTGFVGKSLLDYLNEQNQRHKVVLISRGRQSFDANKWPSLDIVMVRSELGQLTSEMIPLPIDYVIHAGNSSNAEANDYNYLLNTVVNGTAKLLEICVGLKPKAILYLSSGAVYGLRRTAVKPIAETDPGRPANDTSEAYGNLKRVAEGLCEDFQTVTGIPTVIARCFAFSGSNLDRKSHFALVNFLNDAMEGKPILIKGNGKAIRSYMDQSDLAHWLMVLLTQNKGLGIFNVGSDEALSIHDLALAVADLFPGVTVSIENNQETAANYYCPDISLAQKQFGLKLTIPLKESLKIIIQDRRNLDSVSK